MCQPDGWCSFPDALCPSSQRYGEFSGGRVAGRCVPVVDPEEEPEEPGGPEEPSAPEEPEGSTGDEPVEECEVDDDCADALFCNGMERCQPEDPWADAFGCVAGIEPCAGEAKCSEFAQSCEAACADTADADDDGHDSVRCGGDDCDDSNPGIAGPGDWAHCSACGDSCGVLEACERGVCIPARRVFTSSTRHTGDLGGLAGADAQCQMLAESAALGGDFRAYLVGQGAGLGRLEHPSVPFVRLDGVRVADDWEDLADMSIASPMTLNELRHPVGGRAWTGLIDVLGGFENNHCNGWTHELSGCLEPGQPCGGAGQTTQVGDTWDGYFVYHCSQSFRLYCIEQGPDG